MILIIDNYDSFTYNLVQQVERIGYTTIVALNDQLTSDELDRINPEGIIISPGPGKPKDAGFSGKVIEKYFETIPILGVCLGHQCIGELFGAQVVSAKTMMHGKTTQITHDETMLFHGCPDPMVVARYHSLVLDRIPDGFHVTSNSPDGDIMSMEHDNFPLYGVQFHPESFLTPEGDQIMNNFLSCTGNR